MAIETFLTELDNMVKVGAYQNHGETQTSNYTVNKDDKVFNGKKVYFDFINQHGLAFPKDFTPDWNGDLIAQELISEFMRALRDKHRRRP